MNSRMVGSRFGVGQRALVARALGALMLAAIAVPALPAAAAGCGACDDDADGLTNAQELSYGTDLYDSDTDGDTISDTGEISSYGTNPLAYDTDGDGFGDWDEIRTYGTNPLVANYAQAPDGGDDADGDGLGGHEEAYIYGTDPLNADTDFDGAFDGQEITFGTNPLVDDFATAPAPGAQNLPGYDGDLDGLGAYDEGVYGTSPTVYDSDGDGLADGIEVFTYGTDPLRFDTDNDMASDGTEVYFGNDPLIAKDYV